MPKKRRPSGVRGEVDGSVTSRCKPEEHRRRNLRVEEIGNARHRSIEGAQAEERRRRRCRDERHREEVHDDETDAEQEHVNVRRQAQRRRDFRSPREMRRAGGNQRHREQRKRKRRRVEDVHQPAVTVPPDELLPEEPDGDEEELQVEPVVPEPEEQVRAEDDRKRPEPEDEAAAARPRQQHVERVGEDDLRDQQPRVVVDRPPVPPPVRVDRDVAHRLDVVLRAGRGQDDRQTSSAPEEVQRRLPDDQRTDDRPERSEDERMRLDARCQGNQEQRNRQGRGNPRDIPDRASPRAPPRQPVRRAARGARPAVLRRWHDR